MPGRIRLVLVTLACVVGCRTSERARSEPGPTPPADARPVEPVHGPEHRCLPAIICDVWEGCALVAGDAKGGWFVEESSRVAKNVAVTVGNVCTTGQPCEAVTLFPDGVVCPPHTIPPLISSPAYTCVLDGGHCVPGP